MILKGPCSLCCKILPVDRQMFSRQKNRRNHESEVRMKAGGKMTEHHQYFEEHPKTTFKKAISLEPRGAAPLNKN